MRTVEIIKTQHGETILFLKRDNQIISIHRLGKSLHNPNMNWQVLCSHIAYWLEDNQYPSYFL